MKISVVGQDKVFSVQSAYTQDSDFSFINSVQGQFVDRTAEWALQREREELLEQKSQQIETLANRLAQYLSQQI